MAFDAESHSRANVGCVFLDGCLMAEGGERPRNCRSLYSEHCLFAFIRFQSVLSWPDVEKTRVGIGRETCKGVSRSRNCAAATGRETAGIYSSRATNFSSSHAAVAGSDLNSLFSRVNQTRWVSQVRGREVRAMLLVGCTVTAHRAAYPTASLRGFDERYKPQGTARPAARPPLPAWSRYPQSERHYCLVQADVNM